METIRKNFDLALAKGEYGERIVRRILEAKGFVVYKPNTPGAHAFDALAIKDKQRCIALDVKAKARRNKYPDTGISVSHYRTYKAFSELHNMPFWIVFVDEMAGDIYGNTLEMLDREVTSNGISYPFEFQGKTRYWPLISMRLLHKLSEQEMLDLQNLSQRSHDYDPDFATP